MSDLFGTLRTSGAFQFIIQRALGERARCLFFASAFSFQRTSVFGAAK